MGEVRWVNGEPKIVVGTDGIGFLVIADANYERATRVHESCALKPRYGDVMYWKGNRVEVVTYLGDKLICRYPDTNTSFPFICFECKGVDLYYRQGGKG